MGSFIIQIDPSTSFVSVHAKYNATNGFCVKSISRVGTPKCWAISNQEGISVIGISFTYLQASDIKSLKILYSN